MKRLLLACLVLVGLVLLIFHQLGRLEELTPRRARPLSEGAMQKLGRLPELSATAVVKPPTPARTQRLEELVRKAHTVMDGYPLLHPEDLFNDYPELETAFLKAIEGHLRIEYQGFFTLAGLSEQQASRFIEISLAGDRDWIAQTKTAAARGVTLEDPAIKLIGRELGSQRKREMEELLGPAGLALRDKYREEREARNAITMMAKASDGPPLTFDQVNRLAAVTTEVGVLDPDRAVQDLDVFQQASEQAAKILTPEQQQVFELIIDAQQAQLLRALSRRRSR